MMPLPFMSKEIFMMKWITALWLMLLSSIAMASVNVVATTTSMGMLARSVGGDAISVTVLAPPNRDAHFLQARPSMMAALRRADLLVAVGAELEVGWLPAALQGAGNPKVHVGQPGYFEAAAQVSLIDVGGPADRSLGDVHPAGNPHVNLDPERMAEVAKALAGRLASIDPANAAAYSERAMAFAEQIAARLPQWRERVAGAPGVVLYHKDANYLMQALDVPIHGYVEAIPGIPPTARQLKALIERLQDKQGIVLQANYQPDRGARFVAGQLNWPHRALAVEPPLDAQLEDWFALIDAWVEAIDGAR
jgi:zinc/manganese transport system substrate-binding protein